MHEETYFQSTVSDRKDSKAGPESRVKFVIANRLDGLGARIVTLLYSLSLARWLEAEILVHWPNNVDLSGASLNYLFADPLMGWYKKTAAGRRIDWLELARSEEVTSVRLVGHYDRLDPADVECFDAIALRSADPKAIATLDGFSEDILRRECQEAFERLQIHPAVAHRVQHYPYLDRLPGAIGVHVRRGDWLCYFHPIHQERFVELDVYFDALDRMGERDIFLTADCRSVSKAFRARYGQRVLTLPSGIWGGFSRKSRRDLQQAWAEMLLLSRCEKIIAGPSNFPRAAALIGGKDMIVLLKPDMSQNAKEMWEKLKGNWGL